MSDNSLTPQKLPRKRRWKRILLAQLALLIVAVPLVEIAARVNARLNGRPHDSTKVREEIERMQSLNQDFTPRPRNDRQLNEQDNPHAAPILHPYLGFEGIDGPPVLDGELRYLRSGADPDRVDILIVGGSVADMFGQPAYGTGPLREILEADPRVAGRKLYFLQFGRGGFKEPQQLNYVTYLLILGFTPEIVINIDGFNEAALGNANARTGTHPVFPSGPHWAHLANWGAVDRNGLDVVVALRQKQHAIEELTSLALDHGLYASSFLSTIVLRRLNTLRKECTLEYDRYAGLLTDSPQRIVTRGPELPGDPKDAYLACVRYWAESSRMLHDICRARSILYLHVLQPTLLDTGSKQLTQKEKENGGGIPSWVEGVQNGYPLMRTIGERLKSQGVNFVDATQIFAAETGDIYYDCCHFDKPGNRLLAKKIGEELLARWDQVK